jgi:hypothetical protein
MRTLFTGSKSQMPIFAARVATRNRFDVVCNASSARLRALNFGL